MQRIEIKHSVKRLVSGGALALAMAFAQSALADDTKSDASRAGDTQHTEQSRVSSLSGLSRDQIKDVQRELASRGLYQGTIDGVAGAKTEAALKNFQTQQGLAVGQIDAKTRDALGLEWSLEPTASNGRQRMRGSDTQPAQKQPVRGTDVDSAAQEPAKSSASGGMSSGTELTSLSEDQRKHIQQVLKDEGFYQGEVDGVVGAQTRESRKRR